MKNAAKQLDNDPVQVRSSHLEPPILSFVGGRNWRLEADFWFPDAAEGVAAWRRVLGYAAVRVFGSFAWRKDAKAR